jgi:hypothetical protein
MPTPSQPTKSRARLSAMISTNIEKQKRFRYEKKR